MLLPIKAICDPKKARRDGTSLIYFQYCYSSTNRTLLNSEIAIPPQYWNKRKHCIASTLPVSYGDFEHLNRELTRMQRLIEDIIEQANNANIEDIGAYVKATFKPKIASIIEIPRPTNMEVHVNPKRHPELFTQIDDYIKSKERKVAPITIRMYRTMKNHLLAYQEYRRIKLNFISFDYNFYQDFIDFLTFEYVQRRRKDVTYGLKTNSIGKTIKQLRIFILDRMKRKIISPIDLTDFKIPTEESDAIYLSFAELSKLHSVDLYAFPHLIEYRDLFVLACLTGLRFSDFSSLRPEDLRMDMLYKKQGKSDHWVVIPMRKEAKDIFNSLFRNGIPAFTNPEFNRHIKTIGKLAGICDLVTFVSKKGNGDVVETKPKYEWITTHTARRSFATNEFLAGTPPKLIMSITGHKSEKDFYRYIRITPEEAANKIKKLWEERNGLTAFSTSKSA